jgi:phosphoribosylformimino-5-aminoimidazole carboxamide ribotide isomerase
VSFEILGVVDLRGGLAVRAQGGQRDKYMPIERVAGESIPPGDAIALKRQYLDRFGLDVLYVADLDAIERRSPQAAQVRALGSGGVLVWLDAGVTSDELADRALECGAARVIVGLETLRSFSELASIASHVGAEKVAFSLDLREGKPIAAASQLAKEQPEDLVVRAADAGAAAVIVLDLARVGAGSGLDLPLIERLRAAGGSVQLYAGGGVRGVDDLRRLRDAGCAGALVASALLDGRITAREVDLCQRTYT